MGQEILRKNPNAEGVRDLLRQLEQQQAAIKDNWRKKQKELQDARDLQVGNWQLDE